MLIIMLIRLEEIHIHMMRTVDELENLTRRRRWGPFTELRSQLRWFGSCSMRDYANKLIYAYLQGAANMANKLLGNAIDNSRARRFYEQVNAASFVSEEALESIFPVSLLAFLLFTFISHSIIIIG